MNKTNKFIRFALMSTLFASAFTGKGNAKDPAENKAIAPKIAYVDLRKVMTVDESALTHASAEWRDLFKDLQAKLKPVDDELKRVQDKYKEARTEFESVQKSNLTSREALQRKAEEFGKLEYELRGKMQEREYFAQDELNKMHNKLAPKIEKVISELRTSQGWDLVVRGEIILDSSSRFDLTDQLLEKLNSQYTKEQQEKKEQKEISAKAQTEASQS